MQIKIKLVLSVLLVGLLMQPVWAEDTTANLDAALKIVGEKISYRVSIAEKEVGSVSTTFAREDGKIKVVSDFTMDTAVLGAPGVVTINGDLTLDQTGQPVSYKLRAEIKGGKQEMTCTFSEGEIKTEALADGASIKKTIPTATAELHVLDNNLIGQYALMCARQKYEVGQTISIAGFVPQTIQLLELKMEVQAKKKITLNGKQVSAYMCNLPSINNVFWVSETGLLLRVVDPRQQLVIELKQ